MAPIPLTKQAIVVIVMAACAAAAEVRAQGSPAAKEEAALIVVWKVHLENTNDHAKVLAACEDFRKKSTNSVFRPVCDGLAAWHALQINEPAAAVSLLEPMLKSQGDALGKVVNTMAKRWLTRLDREKVKLALKRLYRQNIEFPPSLDAMKSLPEADQGPFVDRWKQTWIYRLAEFKSPQFKNLRGQKYELQSAALKTDSDLAAALKAPYAARLSLKPSKLLSASPGKETVEFVTSDENPKKVILTAGTESEGMSFPFAGTGMLILSDGDYWAILPRPR